MAEILSQDDILKELQKNSSEPPVYDPMTESNNGKDNDAESDAEAGNETYVPEPQPPTTPIKSLGCEC